MAIEIKELTVNINLEEKSTHSDKEIFDIERIVEECVSQVMEIIESRNEV